MDAWDDHDLVSVAEEQEGNAAEQYERDISQMMFGQSDSVDHDTAWIKK